MDEEIVSRVSRLGGLKHFSPRWRDTAVSGMRVTYQVSSANAPSIEVLHLDECIIAIGEYQLVAVGYNTTLKKLNLFDVRFRDNGAFCMMLLSSLEANTSIE